MKRNPSSRMSSKPIVMIVTICLIGISTGIILNNGKLCAAASQSTQSSSEYYKLNITSLESNEYYIGYAHVTISSDDGTIYNGYILNTTLMKEQNYPYYYYGYSLGGFHFNCSQNYTFIFGKTVWQAGGNTTLEPAEWLLQGGKEYKISSSLHDEIIEGHKKGNLAYEKTIKLNSDTNLPMVFSFEPKDKVHSENELKFVESVAGNSILFFLTWVIILLTCTITGVVLQKKRRNLQAFLLTYIPVFTLVGFCLYFSQFNGGLNDFKLVLSGMEDFNYSLTMFTLAVCLIFGFHSFFNYRHYKKEAYFGENRDACMFMKKLYFWSSIILTLGIIILFVFYFIYYYWRGGFMCYAPGPPSTPLKPKSMAVLSLLSMKRKELLENLHANGRIDKIVYNKIKRNF
ncbi:MAG: hypothetical protein KJ886_03620 [Candidatus Thermoplasmatota archaeon]|nr:hypothetical protein [Candidatus Thermoplasmatota archaeon]MCG2826848.1 hypothetical protein [Thermoplasmatales archaeon]